MPIQEYNKKWRPVGVGAFLHRTSQSGEDTVANISFSGGAALKDILPKQLGIVKIPDGLHVGLSPRIRQIARNVGGGDNVGAGADLGFLYFLPELPGAIKGSWTAALVIQEMNMPSVSGPVVYRLGMAWRGLDSARKDMVTQWCNKIFPERGHAPQIRR